MADRAGRPPQTLDDLLFRAEEFARFSLRARGQVPPALLALGPDGPRIDVFSRVIRGESLLGWRRLLK